MARSFIKRKQKIDLNPVWEDEKIVVPVRPDGSGGRMILEVYDADMLTKVTSWPSNPVIDRVTLSTVRDDDLHSAAEARYE